MPAPPYLRLFVSDYLADTQHLSAAEHGGYILLLMACWQRGGMLPQCARMCRRIARMDEQEWSESGDLLLSFFEETPDGYRHKRIDQEIGEFQAISEKNRRAANARWGYARNAGAMPAHMQTQCPPPPPSSSSSLRSEEDNAHADGASDRPREQQSRAMTPEKGEQAKRAMTEDFDAFWDLYPRKVSKGRAQKAFPKARKLVDQSTLIAAVQRYAARVRGKDAEFVAHAATWLNDQRWLDQEPEIEGRRSSEAEPDSHADRGERIAALVRSRYGGSGVRELSGSDDLGILPRSGREIAGRA